MKLKNFAPLFLVIVVLASCKKEVLTKPVEFPETTYQNVGTFDSDGTPNYLITPRDVISPTMLSFINSTLVEKTDLRTTHPELLSNTAIADIAITKPSNVTVTFVFTNTTSSNALAFYTYPTNTPPASPKDIKTITYFFPSTGVGTKLKAGDKVNIGKFQAGTSIGFVLLKSAWDPATSSLNNKVVHFASNDVLNPELDPGLKKHAVLINYAPENKLLIGFENTDRTSKQADHDFNDAVFYATVTQ